MLNFDLTFELLVWGGASFFRKLHNEFSNQATHLIMKHLTMHCFK